VNKTQWIIDSIIIIGVMLLVTNPLACHLDNNSAGDGKHSAHALEKGILFAMSQPDKWRDPHGLMSAGNAMRPRRSH